MFRITRFRIASSPPSTRRYATAVPPFRDGRALVGVALGLFGVNLLLRRGGSDVDALLKEAHETLDGGHAGVVAEKDWLVRRVESARDQLKSSTSVLNNATSSLEANVHKVRTAVVAAKDSLKDSLVVHADTSDATARVEAARQRLIASTARLNHENERVLMEKKTVLVEVSPEEAARMGGGERSALDARLAKAEANAKADYARRASTERGDAVKVVAENRVAETEAELRKRADTEKAKLAKRIAAAEAARQKVMDEAERELPKNEAPIDSFHHNAASPSAEEERAKIAKRVAAAQAAREKMAIEDEKAHHAVEVKPAAKPAEVVKKPAEVVKEVVKEVKHVAHETSHTVKGAIGTVMGALGLSADQEKARTAKRIAAAEAARQKLVDAESGAEADAEEPDAPEVEETEPVKSISSSKKPKISVPISGNLRKDFEAQIAAERAQLRKEAKNAPLVYLEKPVEKPKAVEKKEEPKHAAVEVKFERPAMSADEERSFLEKRVAAAEAARQRLLDGVTESEVASSSEKKRILIDIPTTGNLRKDFEARIAADRARLKEMQKEARIAALEASHAAKESGKPTVAKAEATVKETVAKVETKAAETVAKVEAKAVETAGKAATLLHAAEAKAKELAHEAKEKLVELEHKAEAVAHEVKDRVMSHVPHSSASVSPAAAAVSSAASAASGLDGDAQAKLNELQKKAEELLHRAEAAVHKVEQAHTSEGSVVGDLVKRAEEAVNRAHDAARRADESRKAIIQTEAGIYSAEKRMQNAQDKVKDVTHRAEELLRKRSEEDELKRALITKKLAEEAKKRAAEEELARMAIEKRIGRSAPLITRC